MKNQMKVLIAILAATVLTNCSPKAFQAGVSSVTGNENGGQSIGSAPSTTPTSKPIDTVDMQGLVESTQAPSYNKALTFDFDKKRGEFIIMIPFPSGVFFSPSGSFPSHPDITYGPAMDAQGAEKLAVRIPIKYIIKGVSLLPTARLPNGDILPRMPQGYGELPSLALSFPSQNNMQVSLYLGVNAVGLFVTLPENIAIPFGFSFPVKSADKTKTFGFLTYVPPKGIYPPGMFVSSIIPANVSRILEDYFHL